MARTETEIIYPPAAEIIATDTDKAFCQQALRRVVTEGRMSIEQAAEYSRLWFGADLGYETSNA